ncbi:MAG: metallophosphoesterase family protein [Vulcanimicrobiaceae bacterium]
MALTIVHCADIHLATTFPELRGGSVRRAALAAGFSRIIDLARERAADVLTIGGDLYESERAGPQTARFLFEEFERFGKPVYIAPGNHDPYAPGALLARADLPANVRVCNEAGWRAFPLAGDVTLFGFAHTPAEPGRPFERAQFDRAGVCIALVHGSDEDRCPPNKRATAPFTLAEARRAGAALVLAGHYHGGYVVGDGVTQLAYPGSPEPIKFGERGNHGVLVVRIEGDSVEVTPIETARTRLLDVGCDLGGAAHEPAVLGRIGKALAECTRDDFVRLRLTGAVERGTRIDPATIDAKFGSTVGALAIDDATIQYDFAACAAEPTVRGRVTRELLAAAQGADARSAGIAAAALRYALAAFEANAEIVP